MKYFNSSLCTKLKTKGKEFGLLYASLSMLGTTKVFVVTFFILYWTHLKANLVLKQWIFEHVQISKSNNIWKIKEYFCTLFNPNYKSILWIQTIFGDYWQDLQSKTWDFNGFTTVNGRWNSLFQKNKEIVWAEVPLTMWNVPA